MTSMIEGGSGNLFSDRIIERLTRLATEVSNMRKEKQPWQTATSL